MSKTRRGKIRLKCKLCDNEMRWKYPNGICDDCWRNIDCCGLEKL